MQKVYVTEEEKAKLLEKLNRDVEVGDFICSVLFTAIAHLCHTMAASTHDLQG